MISTTCGCSLHFSPSFSISLGVRVFVWKDGWVSGDAHLSVSKELCTLRYSLCHGVFNQELVCFFKKCLMISECLRLLPKDCRTPDHQYAYVRGERNAVPEYLTTVAGKLPIFFSLFLSFLIFSFIFDEELCDFPEQLSRNDTRTCLTTSSSFKQWLQTLYISLTAKLLCLAKFANIQKNTHIKC